MSERREFEMTQEDLDALYDACKPTPLMYLSGGVRMGPTPQENANYAWAALGRKMGFDGTTVQPLPGKGDRFFTATVTPTVETLYQLGDGMKGPMTRFE